MRKSRPVTIGELIRDRKLIEIGCTACGHHAYFFPSDLGLGEAFPVPAVYQKCRCSKCGVKGRGYRRADPRQPGQMSRT